MSVCLNAAVLGAFPDSSVLDNYRAIATIRPDSTDGISSPQIHPIITDHLGTPRYIASPTNALVWSFDGFEPFGNQLPNEMISGGKFTYNGRFAGQRFDELGFDGILRERQPRAWPLATSSSTWRPLSWNDNRVISSVSILVTMFDGVGCSKVG